MRRETVELSLRRNALWMMWGHCVYGLCQWGTLVVLARLGGPATVGQFALALALTAPIITFSQLQLRPIQVADARGRYLFADLLATRVVATGAAAVVIVAVALLHEPGMLAVTLIIGVAKCFESLSDIFYGLEQRRRRLDLVAQSMMIRGTLGLAALAVVIAVTERLVLGLLAMAVVWALVWLLFDRRVTAKWRRAEARDYEAKADADRLRRRLQLARTGVPLAIALTLGALNTNVPRYFIEGFMDPAALGVFAAIAGFVAAGQMVIQSLCQAAAPELANCFAAGDLPRFRRLLGKLGIIGLGFGVCGLLTTLLLGANLLAWFYGPDFAAHADLFVWLMLGGLVAYTFAPVGYALTASQTFQIQPLILGLALAVNTTLCAILVPTLGLPGAALAWLAACLVEGGSGLSVLWWRVHRLLPSWCPPKAASPTAVSKP